MERVEGNGEGNGGETGLFQYHTKEISFLRGRRGEEGKIQISPELQLQPPVQSSPTQMLSKTQMPRK